MKALVYVAEKQLEVRDVPEPEGEFLVRVLGCAICGTDLKTLLHGHPYFKPPTILGHEFYGVVDKAPAGCGYAPGDLRRGGQGAGGLRLRPRGLRGGGALRGVRRLRRMPSGQRRKLQEQRVCGGRRLL